MWLEQLKMSLGKLSQEIQEPHPPHQDALQLRPSSGQAWHPTLMGPNPNLVDDPKQPFFLALPLLLPAPQTFAVHRLLGTRQSSSCVNPMRCTHRRGALRPAGGEHWPLGARGSFALCEMKNAFLLSLDGSICFH